jgi:hypothetical protein
VGGSFFLKKISYYKNNLKLGAYIMKKELLAHFWGHE